jgi:hypothetical protein
LSIDLFFSPVRLRLQPHSTPIAKRFDYIRHFNRCADQYRGPFQTVQAFNRCALLKSLTAAAGVYLVRSISHFEYSP